MSSLIRAVVAFATSLVAVAAAGAADGPEEARLNALALDRMVAGQARVMRVADRIRIAGAPWCGKKVAPVIGVYAPDQFSIRDLYSEHDAIDPFVEAAAERFALERMPRVVATVPGLAAEAAGLLPGDLVTEVDGKASKKRVFLDVLQNRGENGTVELEVDRDGAPVRLRVSATMGCPYPSRFWFGTAINAFATSFGSLTGMYVYSGMLEFLPEDDDLAIIMGHELAHLVLSHTRGLGTREQEEADADYLGLYFAARAGFDVARAGTVWDRMARENPNSSIDTGFYTHPVDAKRSLALDAALEEIEQLRARGEPLEPTKGRHSLRAKIPDEALKAHIAALREQALAAFRADQERAQVVSYRLAVAGIPDCGKDVAPVLGAMVARRQDFGRHRADEVAAAFGVGDDVTVVTVAPGSPADRAGLRPGDRLKRVDGSRVRKSTQVYDRLRSSKKGPIPIELERDDESLELALPRELGCHYGTMLLPYSGAETTNDGNRKDMLVATGLLRFVRDDDELAVAIAHQMGHHILDSFRETDDEPTADELGIAIAARAGFDVSKAPDYWDRWASVLFWKISSDTDGDHIPHGTMASRAPAIRRAVAKAQQPPPPGPGS